MPGLDSRVRQAINKRIELEPPLYWTKDGRIGIQLAGAMNVDAQGNLIAEVGGGVAVVRGPKKYELQADLVAVAKGLTDTIVGFGNAATSSGGGSGSILLANTLPEDIDGSVPGNPGSSTKAAHGDHVHAVVFSTTTPLDTVLEGAADPGGTVKELAAIDHVHSAQKGSPVEIGFENAAGGSGLFADAEHVHAGNPTSLAYKQDAHTIQAYKRRGVWTAGTVAADTDVLNHNGADLYPFMVATCIDVDGYPHHRHKRLEGSGVGNDSGLEGYEDGTFIGAGVLTTGRGIGWSMRGTCTNSLNADVFYEFVLEPNPTVAVFAGTYRMRMVTGNLGLTWTGSRAFTFDGSFKVTAADAYVFQGVVTITKASGEVCFKKTLGGSVTGGFDFLNDDAVMQLRWRADRLASLNTYSATYQGAGASISVTDYEVLELAA